MQTGLGPADERTRAVVRAAEERGLRPVVQENRGEAHVVTEVHLRNGEGEAASRHGVETVLTEVIDTSHVAAVRRVRERVGYTGQILLWIGARTNNLVLLQELGRQRDFPVMLKNPIDARSVGEWVGRAEYIL